MSQSEKREPIEIISISAMDAIDGLQSIVTSILGHMAACSNTLIPTMLADIDSAGGLSDASKDFAKSIFRAAELSVKNFHGEADA